MQTQTQPTPPLSLVKPNRAVPIKVAWFGGQGSGKTTSAALLSLALSKEVYGGAPVYVTDTEPGWQFLKPLFAKEGVDLIQRTDPTFKAMTANLREAERIGACVWNVDTLSLIWNELLQSFKGTRGFIPIEKWGDIREMWAKDYVALFLNTSMCCQALGRLGNITEEIQSEDSEKTKLVKTGERFKAGGSEDFGYEPHLLLQVSLERKPKHTRKDGRTQQLEGEGRMIHRADVLKDRTWTLNGQVFRWGDKAGYEKGGYRNVWQSIKPHWDAVQATAHVQIATETSSRDLIAPDQTSTYYQRMKRLTIVLEEIEGSLVALWPGRTDKVVEMKRIAVETLFHTRSWEAVKSMPVELLEVGLCALNQFEDSVKAGKSELVTDKDKMQAFLQKVQDRILEQGTEPIEKQIEFEGMQVH